MQREDKHRVSIQDEKGIVEKGSGTFYSPLDFTLENLFYAVWSNTYTCSRHYEVEREHLDFYSVIYVTSGRMELLYEGKTAVIGENEMVLLDFRAPHIYRTHGDHLEKWEMLFKGNCSDAYYEMITSAFGHRFEVKGALKKTLKSLMEELSGAFYPDHAVSLLIHRMFRDIVDARCVTLSGPVEKAVAFMQDNYANPLKINEIADHVALSRPFFSRRFTKETGRSPYDYLAQIRINAAKEMLLERTSPVADIAELCGFTNASHFTRFFKEKTGCTPAAFRAQYNLL